MENGITICDRCHGCLHDMFDHYRKKRAARPAMNAEILRKVMAGKNITTAEYSLYRKMMGYPCASENAIKLSAAKGIITIKNVTDGSRGRLPGVDARKCDAQFDAHAKKKILAGELHGMSDWIKHLARMDSEDGAIIVILKQPELFDNGR